LPVAGADGWAVADREGSPATACADPDAEGGGQGGGLRGDTASRQPTSKITTTANDKGRFRAAIPFTVRRVPTTDAGGAYTLAQ
jgi:hypothetical protein